MNLERLLTQNNANLQNSNDASWSPFTNICKEALDKIAHLKQKYIAANNGTFMNKDITKTVMKRTRSSSNYLKNRCDANRKAYKFQRNLCVSLV